MFLNERFLISGQCEFNSDEFFQYLKKQKKIKVSEFSKDEKSILVSIGGSFFTYSDDFLLSFDKMVSEEIMEITIKPYISGAKLPPTKKSKSAIYLYEIVDKYIKSMRKD